MSGQPVAKQTRGRFERVLGRYTRGIDGPVVLVCGGLHGNEPAGALAAQRVAAILQEKQPPLRGEWIGVAGNLAALEGNRRFLSMDLNRCWSEGSVRALRARDPSGYRGEDAEQRAIADLVDEAAARTDEPLVLLDLHTTSGDSPPFSLMSDTLPNRKIVFGLPCPVILGLEEAIDGTLLEFMTQRGHRAVVVESGRHDDPCSIDFHESIIWLGLVAAGSLDPADVPGYAGHQRRLREARRTLPRVVEVRSRHEIRAGDGFRMEPGYVGFQRVAEGELLARDRNGAIRAQSGGRILMPLYQDQGDDGFFLVRRVSRFWLHLSAVLRTLRLHLLLPLLPGVHREADQRRTLRVNSKIARWFVVEIFHLFGYRRRRPDGDDLLFSRRRPR